MTKKRAQSVAAPTEVKKPKEVAKEQVVQNPIPTPPAVPKEPEYIPQAFELGRKPSAIPNSEGIPKSKKPWKGLSERSAKHKKMNPKTWKQQMDDKRRLKSVRERVREERDKVKNSKKEVARRLREKKKRKEINEMKSATYQIIKNAAKAKMWNKKARKQITKLPAEIFYAKYK